MRGGVEAWTEALRQTICDPARRTMMRGAALDYAGRSLAGWGEVLAEDLYAVWREATEATSDALIA